MIFSGYNQFVRGHESTHALRFYGKEDVLIKALQAHRFILNPFERYEDEEEQCDVGGIFALYQKGWIEKTPRDRRYLLNDLLASRR
ncbi:hypothetical protein HYT55_02795 [Candidatus Woesearchaeota archaeon]|nr:hypothetical protein [Candidatus Woesearchaeota archaeon]